MRRKLLFLVNPISGTKNKTSLHERIRSRTNEAGLGYEIYPSVESGDYSFLIPIIKEQGFTDIIIAGGDGTINQAVNSLHKLNLPFGIIPCGSGNGLAFSASIPKNTEKALQIIFEGKSQLTDAFMVNEHFSCMLCGLGLDAQVAHDFANDPKRGLRTYISKTLSNFISARAYPFVLKADGKKIETEAFFISVANSNQFGNHFTIAPKARLNDGLLDIVVMTKQNKLSVLFQTFLQVRGYKELQQTKWLNGKASVLYFQVDALKIDNPDSAPMHLDGDPVETALRINIRILKDYFRLICP